MSDEHDLALGPDAYAQWIAGCEPARPLPAVAGDIAMMAAGSSLAALRTTQAAFLLLTDPGCRPSARAFAECAAAIASDPGLDLVFGDEDRVDDAGRRHDPFFKPAWNLDLALEQDLAGGVCLLRRALLDRVGAARVAGVHELALLAGVRRVRHVPAILCHREGPRRTGLDPAVVGGVLAGLGTDRVRPAVVPSRFGGRRRVRWQLVPPLPRVSVVIPTRDQPELLARCTEGLLRQTDYPDLEVLIADNGSSTQAARALLAALARDRRVRVLTAEGAFNYAAINNRAAACATGEVLLLLNDDVAVIEPGWLREMVGHALRPDVGAVGARLLFADGALQHAGIVLGVGAFEGGPGIAGHFGLRAPGDAEGHGGQFVLTREVSAVTGACLALRRSVFERVGGLDAANLAVSLNDLDLCLRIRAHGLRVVWTPFAELLHLESASRGSDQVSGAAERFRRECRVIRDRWRDAVADDPFYNVNFSRYDHSFQLRSRPEGSSLSPTP
ncbi:MAG: hypothetical protein NVSMB18_08040 [Acetobacteraceae bacterium]